MDPTEAELAAISVLAGAIELGPEWTEIYMDKPGKRPWQTRQSQGGVWDRTVAAAKILTGPATPIPTRDLAPVELARVESLRRVCHIRMGQAPDTPGGPAPPQSAVVPPPMGAGPAVAAGSRKFKLSAILDPTLEAEDNQDHGPELLYKVRGLSNEIATSPQTSWQPWRRSSRLGQCHLQTL